MTDDETDLARWSYMTFVGKEGFVTTILVRYNPCSSKYNKEARNTVYLPTLKLLHSERKRHHLPKNKVQRGLSKAFVDLEGGRPSLGGVSGCKQ